MNLTNEQKEILNEDLIKVLLLSDKNFETLEPFLLESLKYTTNKAINEDSYYNQLYPNGLEDITQENYNKALESISNLSNTLSEKKINFLRECLSAAMAIKSGREHRKEAEKVKVPILIELLNEDVKMPQYANIGDSGMDVYAQDEYTILPGETKLIPLGFKMVIPQGYEIQVRPRSGNSLKTKMRVANAPGTVDASYRGELGVIVENIESPIKDISYHFEDEGKVIIDSILHGAALTITKGMKIAQLVLVKVEEANLVKTSSISDYESTRGEGGFGSTDKK